MRLLCKIKPSCSYYRDLKPGRGNGADCLTAWSYRLKTVVQVLGQKLHFFVTRTLLTDLVESGIADRSVCDDRVNRDDRILCYLSFHLDAEADLRSGHWDSG